MQLGEGQRAGIVLHGRLRRVSDRSGSDPRRRGGAPADDLAHAARELVGPHRADHACFGERPDVERSVLETPERTEVDRPGDRLDRKPRRYRAECHVPCKSSTSSTRATATHAIPSPRPIAPIPSLVVALTLTGADSASERRRSISARCSERRGRSQITVASTLTGRAEAAADRDQQHVDRVGVAPLLLVGWEQGPEVTEPGRAEQRVDHGVGQNVGVGVPGEPPLVRYLHPAEDEAAALREPVAVVADPDPGM